MKALQSKLKKNFSKKNIHFQLNLIYFEEVLSRYKDIPKLVNYQLLISDFYKY